jgi:hypothetical protein
MTLMVTVHLPASGEIRCTIKISKLQRAKRRFPASLSIDRKTNWKKVQKNKKIWYSSIANESRFSMSERNYGKEGMTKMMMLRTMKPPKTKLSDAQSVHILLRFKMKAPMSYHVPIVKVV